MKSCPLSSSKQRNRYPPLPPTTHSTLFLIQDFPHTVFEELDHSVNVKYSTQGNKLDWMFTIQLLSVSAFNGVKTSEGEEGVCTAPKTDGKSAKLKLSSRYCAL